MRQPGGNAETGFVIAGEIVDPHGLGSKGAALLLGHQDEDSYSSDSVERSADGSFRAERVAPVTYLFGPHVLRFGYVLAPGSPWWPSRVLLDGKDATNVPIDLSQHHNGQLELVFTQHPARIAGIVSDALGRPANAPWVMVTGSDPASWQPWATTSEVAKGNATGRFALTVPPGEYLVNAVPEGRFPSWSVARDGLHRIAFGGVTVAVKDRETKRVDVTLQER